MGTGLVQFFALKIKTSPRSSKMGGDRDKTISEALRWLLAKYI